MLPVENYDISMHVPVSIKQQICKGEYINLALLLKDAIELFNFCRWSVFAITPGGLIETSAKECKDKIGSIESWTDVFIIFCSIYLNMFPDKTQEIFQYMSVIRQCAFRQPGFARDKILRYTTDILSQRG